MTVGVTNTYGAYFRLPASCPGAALHSGTHRHQRAARCPALLPGCHRAAVTLPAAFGDYVITEFGIAKLFGKTLKQRAQD